MLQVRRCPFFQGIHAVTKARVGAGREGKVLPTAGGFFLDLPEGQDGEMFPFIYRGIGMGRGRTGRHDLLVVREGSFFFLAERHGTGREKIGERVGNRSANLSGVGNMFGMGWDYRISWWDGTGQETIWESVGNIFGKRNRETQLGMFGNTIGNASWRHGCKERSER